MFKSKYYLTYVSLNDSDHNVLHDGDWSDWVAKTQMQGNSVVVKRIIPLSKSQYDELDAATKTRSVKAKGAKK